MMLLTKRKAWKKLQSYADTNVFGAIKQSDHTDVVTDHISLDYRAQGLDDTIMTLLCELADECGLRQRIHALMTGCPINETQKKPILHTALRAFGDEPIFVDDIDVVPQVLAVRERMRLISEQIRQGQWFGYSGKAITDIVNIGIGGSQLGPQFCIDALHPLVAKHLTFHFISDIEKDALHKVTQGLNPETTLFIISSKSFSTQETLHNAKKAMLWLNNPAAMEQHFIAVTAYPKKAEALGITHVLPIWDWVVGRFSVCSAINLITCIAIGYDAYLAFLKGANSMDEHFRHADFMKNLPVLLALLGIWNNNILKIHQLLLLTYAQSLQLFVPYIQQLDMESNGKSLDNQGCAINYSTGPIVWGGLGNQAQHSYYQLLCQGTHRVAADLISVDIYNDDVIHQMCLAHKTVLTHGVVDEDNILAYVSGRTQINHIRLKDCSPCSIGALIALYEHKVFVQGVLWNINPFDQPGVDSSKKLMRKKIPVYDKTAAILLQKDEPLEISI